MFKAEASSVRKSWRIFVFSLFFLSFLAGGALPSHALLLVEDMVYIGPKSSAATYKIKNTTQRPEAYRMEWTNLKMVPGGQKKPIAPGEVMPGVMAADPYMYLSPRRLMIMPDQLQNIRLMVRRPANLPPGEYRSYMVFVPEVIPKAYDPTASQSNESPSRMAVGVDVLTGFRIPVFFLQGETTLKTAVANYGYGRNPKGETGFYFTFTREGNRSALGQMDINCTVGDQVVKLAQTRIQIFTELPSNDYFLPVKEIPQGCATATLDYTPHPEDPDYTGFPVRMGETPLQ